MVDQLIWLRLDQKGDCHGAEVCDRFNSRVDISNLSPRSPPRPLVCDETGKSCGGELPSIRQIGRRVKRLPKSDMSSPKVGFDVTTLEKDAIREKP